MKYHVGEDLIPRQCRATLRDCPYKIERHFSTFKEAQEYADILGEKSNTKMSRDTAEFYANIHQKILKIFPYATQEDEDDITVECQKHNGNNRTLEMLLGHQISIRKDILFGGNFRSYFGATMMNDTEAQDLLFFQKCLAIDLKEKFYDGYYNLFNYDLHKNPNLDNVTIIYENSDIEKEYSIIQKRTIDYLEERGKIRIDFVNNEQTVLKFIEKTKDSFVNYEFNTDINKYNNNETENNFFICTYNKTNSSVFSESKYERKSCFAVMKSNFSYYKLSENKKEEFDIYYTCLTSRLNTIDYAIYPETRIFLIKKGET